MAQIVLISTFRMGPLTKVFVATSASLLLLYYGVAWAVLRCCHDDTGSHQELVLNNIDKNITSHAYTIECVTPVYHAELIAESPSPSRLDRLMSDTTPHINDFLTLTTAKGYRASNLYLRAVFERPFPSDSLRYRSFSILRI